jgi:Fe-S cluster biogenesis protein NfuA
MATPHVAGAWALLKQAQPTLSVTDALAHLRNTGLNVNDTRAGGTVTGLKRINLTSMPLPMVYNSLAVVKAGSGTGTVTSAPAGISCGLTCTAPYSTNTSVTLTASPAAGSVFAGWSGACTGTTTTCTVLMSAASTVTATFNVTPKYTLTVSRTGAILGTVTSSPAGINCGSICTASYNSGTAVKLTAKAASGSAFLSWGGACSGTRSTCTVSMSAAKNVTANFR